MNKELLNKMKTNWTGFGGLSQEMQEAFKKANEAGATLYIREENDWCLRYTSDWDDGYVYRLDRDWQPEPKKRWFVCVADDKNGLLYPVAESDAVQYEDDDEFIEVTEADLPYIQNKPHPDAVLKRPEVGDKFVFAHITEHGVEHGAEQICFKYIHMHSVIQFYRWVLPAEKATDTPKESNLSCPCCGAELVLKGKEQS